MKFIKMSGLVIDWTQMPTYNTIMSLAAGAALLSLLWFGWNLMKGKTDHPAAAWGLNFGVLGFILTATGLHMTLTWPFAKYFPFDNIIFGEPSLGFGVLLLAAAVLLWRRGDRLDASENCARDVARMITPLSIFIVGLGLALIAICFAGIIFQLFAAPPEEPISGAFAAYPWVEAIFMSGLFGIIGVGAVLFPFALKSFSTGAPLKVIHIIIGIVWGGAGIGFLLFGALNYFTHIGLIVNTMG